MAGKGGVGKTTVGATIGLAAAQLGLSTLLVELEGRSSLAAPFGISDPGYETTAIATGIEGAGDLSIRRLTPDEALTDYLVDHGLQLISGRLARSNVIELIATTAPGIRDLVALGKIRALEEANAADLIVVDAPAAGHAITFLRSAAGLAASAPSGPVREQADKVQAMLTDPSRCQVILVTIPEETPVTELIETSYALEDEVGIQLGPVVVNGLWPVIPGLESEAEGDATQRADNESARIRRDATAYRLSRHRSQSLELKRLSDELPLPQIRLPFLFVTEIDRGAIAELADSFIQSIANSDKAGKP